MTTDPFPLVHSCARCSAPNVHDAPGGLCDPCFDADTDAFWDAIARSHRSEGVSAYRCPACSRHEAYTEGGLCFACAEEAAEIAEDGEEVEA